MTSYTLIYFNSMARGEVSRMLFALAGVEYIDKRLVYEDWGPEDKKAAPFGQIPVLEVEGYKLCQSRAIEGFLARRFGLAGRTDLDQARAAMIVDCVEEVCWSYSEILFVKDEQKKAENAKIFQEGPLATYLTNFEKILEENNCGDGYFVGDGLTYADISFYHHTCMITPFTGINVSWETWPKLQTLRTKVEQQSQIAAWIKKRPVTKL